MDVAAWRRETRARLIDRRQRIPLEKHHRESLAVRNLLEAVIDSFPPRIVSGYWPFKGEVDLRPLMERLREKSWTTALPAVTGSRRPLEFLRWDSDTELVSGVYGIPVPRNREIVRPDIVIMPVVGFDAGNYRLGYGAGFFDITLASMRPRPHTIGIGFELARLETIYPLATDIPLDLIVTEAGTQGALS